MNLYNMLFGRERLSDLYLAHLGLKEHDVERFRDAGFDRDTGRIWVRTRTGGGNRKDYPNVALRRATGFVGSADDDFDSTYCVDEFEVEAKWRADVAALENILEHGMRRAYARHLSKTLLRTPTPADVENVAERDERHSISRLRHEMANGHTFVPFDDIAAEGALRIAEQNNGKLRTCWGILPLKLKVEVGTPQSRVAVYVEWEIDDNYLAHMSEKFGAKYPKAMAEVQARAEHAKKVR